MHGAERCRQFPSRVLAPTRTSCGARSCVSGFTGVDTIYTMRLYGTSLIALGLSSRNSWVHKGGGCDSGNSSPLFHPSLNAPQSWARGSFAAFIPGTYARFLLFLRTYALAHNVIPHTLARHPMYSPSSYISKQEIASLPFSASHCSPSFDFQ